MTDSSAFYPGQEAVTSDCMYTLKPSAVRSRSYRMNVPSSNKQTFSGSGTDVGIFYLAGGRRNTYLDPTQTMLKLTVQNLDTTATLSFDNNAGSLIDKLEIYHGSNLLETIQGLQHFVFIPVRLFHDCL